MSRAVVAHSADIAVLQALTTWLNGTALLSPGTITGKLTPHMVNAYHIAPGHNASDEDVHRVIRAAGKAVSTINALEAEKENLVQQVNEQAEEAKAQHPHSTRKQRSLAKAQTDKIAAQVVKAKGKVKHRTDTQLAQAQVTYHHAYRAALQALNQHRKDTAAEEEKAEKDERAQLRQQVREQRQKLIAEQAQAQQELRDAAARAKADNEAESRAWNRNAARLNQNFSKEARKRRNTIELNTLALQKRLAVLTAYELNVRRLPDPAPELDEKSEEKSAEQQ